MRRSNRRSSDIATTLTTGADNARNGRLIGSNGKGRGGGISRSDNVKFENEDDALAYAKRLASLKPGDAVFTKAAGQEPQRGIFLGPVDDGKRAHVLYFDEDRELAGKGTPWSGIRFPE